MKDLKDSELVRDSTDNEFNKSLTIMKHQLDNIDDYQEVLYENFINLSTIVEGRWGGVRIWAGALLSVIAICFSFVLVIAYRSSVRTEEIAKRMEDQVKLLVTQLLTEKQQAIENHTKSIINQAMTSINLLKTESENTINQINIKIELAHSKSMEDLEVIQEMVIEEFNILKDSTEKLCEDFDDKMTEQMMEMKEIRTFTQGTATLFEQTITNILLTKTKEKRKKKNKQNKSSNQRKINKYES